MTETKADHIKTVLGGIKHITVGIAADCLKLGLPGTHGTLWINAVLLTNVCLQQMPEQARRCIPVVIGDMLDLGYNQEVAELMQLSHDLDSIIGAEKNMEL
jgi:hypothetical protein